MISKYQVREEVPYESTNYWTVFANSHEHAKELVRDNAIEYLGNILDCTILKNNIKGTNKTYIIKYT